MRCLSLAALLGLTACGGSTTRPAATTDAAPDSAADAAAEAGADALNGFDSTGDVAAMGDPTLQPATHDFGFVYVGAMSDPFVFTITNPGSAPFDTPDLSVNGDFYFTPGGNQCATVMVLAPGDKCTVAVVFKPGSPGAKQGTLVFKVAGQTVMVSLTGSARFAPTIAISPMNHAFVGVVGQVGQPVSFTIANLGKGADLVTAALGGANADQFKLTGGCVAPVPALGSCTVDVSFAPTSAGMKTATLTIRSPVGGMALATLTGTAN
jgi:hypothetical protein